MKIQLLHSPYSSNLEVFLFENINHDEIIVHDPSSMKGKIFKRDELVSKDWKDDFFMSQGRFLELYRSLKEGLENHGLLARHPSEEVVEQLRERVFFLEHLVKSLVASQSKEKEK